MFGFVNAIICIPVMLGFGFVVFRDPFFEPIATQLVPLALIAGVIHQTVFGFRSRLPFSIAQVQDAGAVFLCTVAGDIISSLREEDAPGTDILATVLIGLGLATALLGLALILTGKLGLVGIVHYLPMPVIGGYLAYVGFVCLLTALTMGGDPITRFTDIPTFLLNWETVLLAAPGVALGGILLFVSGRFRHFAVLPSLLVGIPIVFYLVLWTSGVNSETAREHGWLPASSAAAGYMVPRDPLGFYAWFRFDRVHWDILPQHLPTWLGDLDSLWTTWTQIGLCCGFTVFCCLPCSCSGC